jgi:hypothetical protein
MKIKFKTGIGKKISLNEWVSYGTDLQDRIMKNCLSSEDIERILYGRKKKSKA